MSELRPSTPAQRPVTARPRDEPVPDVDPPTLSELTAIQRHVVEQPGLVGASVEVDEDLRVTFVMSRGRSPDLTYAAMPRWEADDWEQSLATVSQRMRAQGAWPSMLLFDQLDEPPGLDRELQQRDWIKVTDETIMWVGHASVVPHLDPVLRIEAVQARAVEHHEELERQIFRIDPAQADRRRKSMARALAAGQVRAWIVWLADEPVAVARLSQGDGVAGLQGIGVVEPRRGQGFATLITTIATRAGMAVGNRVIWLSVDDDNAAALKVYTRLGFKPAFSCARWLTTEDPRRRRA